MGSVQDQELRIALSPGAHMPDRSLSVSPGRSVTPKSPSVTDFLSTGSNWLYAGVFFILSVAVVVLAVLLAKAPTSTPHATNVPEFNAVVKTKLGSVQGTILAKGRQFLGIPYANVGKHPPYDKEPDGEPHGRLFAPARMVQPWCTGHWCTPSQPQNCTNAEPRCLSTSQNGGMRDATKASDVCVQVCSSEMRQCTQQDVNNQKVIGVEDCLSLNVFTPLKRSGDALKGYPVMVFIHGGGFVRGSGDQYNGSSLATSLPDDEVVIVTLNYRLGLFGFFQDPLIKNVDRAWSVPVWTQPSPAAVFHCAPIYHASATLTFPCTILIVRVVCLPACLPAWHVVMAGMSSWLRFTGTYTGQR